MPSQPRSQEEEQSHREESSGRPRSGPSSVDLPQASSQPFKKMSSAKLSKLATNARQDGHVVSVGQYSIQVEESRGYIYLARQNGNIAG